MADKKDDNWLTVGLIGGGIALLMAIFGLAGGNKNSSSDSGGDKGSSCLPCQAKRGM